MVSSTLLEKAGRDDNPGKPSLGITRDTYAIVLSGAVEAGDWGEGSHGFTIVLALEK